MIKIVQPSSCQINYKKITVYILFKKNNLQSLMENSVL